MKQNSRKILFVLGLSLLFSSFNLGAFAADKDYPVIYSIVKPLPTPVDAQPPVIAD